MTRTLAEKKYARYPLTEADEHKDFLNRISKTLYYTKVQSTDCLSLPVTELAAEFFNEVKNGQTLERLDVVEASRISRNACVSPCSLVMALIYIERLRDCNPEYLQKVAPSELFLVSLLVACKFLSDDGEEDEVFNPEWAKSGRLSVAKLNQMEKEFLKAINWTVFVDTKDFWERLRRLEEVLAFREAGKRGWFSYTELHTLLGTVRFSSLLQTVLGISSVCVASYIAGLMTLLGSATIATSIPKALLSSEQLILSTLLSSEQQTLSSSASDLPYSSLVDESTQTDLEEEIENILIDMTSEKAEMCNQTHPQKNFVIHKCTDAKKENWWKWFTDSVTFWVSYSDSKSNCSSYWENHFNQNSGYSTKINPSEQDSLFSIFDTKTNKKESFDHKLNSYRSELFPKNSYLIKYLIRG